MNTQPLRKRLVYPLLAVFCAFSFSPALRAQQTQPMPYQPEQVTTLTEGPDTEDMIYDGLLVRPAALVGTAVGAGIFLVTLPFTLFSGSTSKAGEKLVKEPAEYTFKRCLGCFEHNYR